MPLLILSPTEIIIYAVLLLLIYAYAFNILIKNKSGLIPYLILICLPVLGSLYVILSGSSTRNK